ncbi:MAG: glycosyltransferase family 2 protein [Candidatus Woesearchaeota archaeon]
MKKIKISVLVPAYNEEQNIYILLSEIAKQKLKTAEIKEVIVINDGSTDNTEREVKKAIAHKILKDKLKLITFKSRKGKYYAINLFLKIAKSPVLIMESADTIPKRDAYEKLARNFKNNKVGAVASRIIPLNKKNTFFGFTAHLIYKIHHELSLKQPKFGEMIAFRNNLIKRIRPTTVDEEEIARLIQQKRLLLKYEPEAIVYNKSPETIADFINQQKRNYCGHLILAKRYKYNAATLKSWSILKTMSQNITIRNIPQILGIIFLGIISRALGFIDYTTRKSEDVLWHQIKSIKNLKK